MGKTLQAMTEEAAELAEQEELQRQEQGLRDMQARQQVEEVRNTVGEGEEGEDGDGERDLDDEIPDAEVGEASGMGGDVTFNEESMVEGSSRMVDQEQTMAMEEAELTGAARDEEDLGVERNLDDSIPEAGSYQHTDTEAEDSSNSESELQDSFSRPNPPSTSTTTNRAERDRRSLRNHAQLGLGDDNALMRSPGSLDLSSSLVLESSFVGNSPVVQRGHGRGRGAGTGAGERRGRLS